jgi:hypothetical protein
MVMSKMLQAVLTTTALTATRRTAEAKPYRCVKPVICKAACGSTDCMERMTTAKRSSLATPVLGQVIALR